MTTTLTSGQLYPFTYDYREATGVAEIQFKWAYSGSGYSIVPFTAFLEQTRVGGTVYTVEIDPSSVPAACTIESAPSTATAGTTYTVSIKSRQSDNTVSYDAIGDDTYTVILTHSSGSPVFTVTAVA